MASVRVGSRREAGRAHRVVPAGLRHRLDAWLLGGRRRARLYARLRRRVRLSIVGPGTRIVIEGYPRSANTYAATAFRLANEGQRYASHLHSPLNVELGIRRGIPVVVLLRDPLDAVVSELQFEPRLPADLAVRAYIGFYRRVAPLLDRVLLVSFETATTDFGRVIDAVNTRFGTDFHRYEPTAAHEGEVRAMIDWEDRLFRGEVPGTHRTVARPDSERDVEKPELQRLLTRSPHLETARLLYKGLRPMAL